MSRIPIQLKAKILEAIKDDGITTQQASEEYGVKVWTIQYWLRTQVENEGSWAKIHLWKVRRLAKQNEDFLLIIWELTAELNKIKKKK
jgi:transposase-like protein